MSLEITWHGHATWSFKTDQHQILVDPFFTDNPAAVVAADDVEADYILISHAHSDHIADAAPIAQRTGAQVICNYEIANWLQNNHGIENVVGMNIGGAFKPDFGTVKMVPAWHSSSFDDGTYGGEPAGFLLRIGETTIYMACDTALFTDMQLIGAVGIDVAILPIGDLYTMGPTDSVTATNFIKPAQVFPAHYNTWPPIEQDVELWAEKIKRSTSANPVVLQPGDTQALA